MRVDAHFADSGDPVTGRHLDLASEYNPINLGAAADSHHTMRPIMACHG